MCCALQRATFGGVHLSDIMVLMIKLSRLSISKRSQRLPSVYLLPMKDRFSIATIERTYLHWKQVCLKKELKEMMYKNAGRIAMRSLVQPR